MARVESRRIAQLMRHGIREVTIDLERGLDIGDVPTENTTVVSSEPVNCTNLSRRPRSRHPPLRSRRCVFRTPWSSRAIASKAAYREALETMERIFNELEAGQSPKIVTLKNVVTGLVSRILSHPESMMTRVLS